jgi:hypothetical protein
VEIPAHSVRGPKHVVKKGKRRCSIGKKARALLEQIDTDLVQATRFRGTPTVACPESAIAFWHRYARVITTNILLIPVSVTSLSEVRCPLLFISLIEPRDRAI